MLLYLVVYLVLTLSSLSYGEIRYVLQLASALLVYLIGYFTIRESSVLQAGGAESDQGSDQKAWKKIEHYMIMQTPYLNANFDVSALAHELSMGVTAISKTINQNSQSNFSDWVNRYRIRHAQELILDPEFDNYKLAAIGQESGFRNKGSFHRAFKKIMGETPSEYRKRHTAEVTIS